MTYILIFKDEWVVMALTEMKKKRTERRTSGRLKCRHQDADKELEQKT